MAIERVPIPDKIIDDAKAIRGMVAGEGFGAAGGQWSAMMIETELNPDSAVLSAVGLKYHLSVTLNNRRATAVLDYGTTYRIGTDTFHARKGLKEGTDFIVFSEAPVIEYRNDPGEHPQKKTTHGLAINSAARLAISGVK